MCLSLNKMLMENAMKGTFPQRTTVQVVGFAGILVRILFHYWQIYWTRQNGAVRIPSKLCS